MSQDNSSRNPPEDYDRLYGPHAKDMREDRRFFSEARDRAAFVLVTGIFPSHLRRTYTDFLRHITRYSRKPTSLDGRTGNLKICEDVVAHLELERHTMVAEVRSYMRRRYLVQSSRGIGTRRNFGKIYMFRLNSDNLICDRITVKGDGATKYGWDD
jgi:hypothetical protein